jgi:DNA-binding LacI/PurR family transcriptional regulator
MRKKSTSLDVARLADVSQSAVSRTFTPGSHISEKMRKKVMAAANQLGYKPNAIARSLITRRSNMIGVIMGDITNPFYPEVLRALTDKLQAEGLRLILFTVAQDQSVDDLLPKVMEYQLDGLIITSAKISSEGVEESIKQGMPVVLFNRYVRGSLANAVCCDNAEGGRIIANLLIDAGHRYPAIVTGSADTSTGLDRERGFCSRLEERGLAEPMKVCGHFSYEGGVEAARSLLNAAQRPDAVFCANDIMAIGFIDTARNEFGLKLPEDISVVGFDDISLAAWPSFGLTTARQRIHSMIDATLEILSQRIADPNLPPEIRLIPGILRLRTSCRLPEKLDGYGWEVR